MAAIRAGNGAVPLVIDAQVRAPSVFTQADGVRFLEAAGVQVEGHGEPLLLLNGLLHDQEMWGPLVRHLTACRRVIRFDFPHQNRSALANGYNDFDRYCDFVQDLLGALGLNSAETDAFGFSIGGDVLRALTVERGVRFRHVILCASAPPGIDRFWKEFFTGALDCLRHEQFNAFVRLIAFQFYSPMFIEQYPKLLSVMYLRYRQRFPDVGPLETLLNMPLQRRPPDPKRDLALRGRTTLIHSLYDQLVPIAPARAYAHQLALPVHEIETGHSLLAEAPDEVARLAMKILNAVR